MSVRTFCLAAIALAVSVTGTAPLLAAEEVNIYSYRKEVLIRPLLDAFTETTGIRVNIVSGKADALLERLKSEGINSPADVLLTTDAGRLIRARAAGVLQPISSPVLEAAIPSQYRDPRGHWFGLSVRSRVMFYAPDRVRPEELTTYEDLASPKWRNRICIRSSSNIYNQSLLASLIAHNGAEAAEQWARAVVANMARKPQGGDRDQIKAVAAGQCDVAVANSYYFGGMLTSGKASEREPAAKVVLFWPNQQGRGAHVNISGAGITKSAPNKVNALKLLEFLAGRDAQRLYAEVVYEYPVRADAKLSGVVAGFGAFKADALNLAVLADHNAEAVRMFDRAGWR